MPAAGETNEQRQTACNDGLRLCFAGSAQELSRLLSLKVDAQLPTLLAVRALTLPVS
jgi:hypothetical protein